MGALSRWWEGRVLPRVVENRCGVPELDEPRARVTAQLHGDVVELGFGTGRNLPYLPPAVTRLHAVEPQDEAARRIGGERLAASAVPVTFVGLDGQSIPLEDASMDAALSTFTLCTIPDAGRALAEVRRVLKPGGRLHFLEHGLADDPAVERWQHRLTPVQRRVFGGCHLDRDIAALVTAAGFRIDDLTTGYRLAPKAFGFLYEGAATPA